MSKAGVLGGYDLVMELPFKIYSNDHGPAHAHVKGRGAEVRIGQNGRPLVGNPELSKIQQKVIDQNIGAIRGNIGSAMARYRANGGC